MSISTTHRTAAQAGVDERRRRVEAAVHSGEMEGLQVTPAMTADAADYVDGTITSDELLARVQARYRAR